MRKHAEVSTFSLVVQILTITTFPLTIFAIWFSWVTFDAGMRAQREAQAIYVRMSEQISNITEYNKQQHEYNRQQIDRAWKYVFDTMQDGITNNGYTRKDRIKANKYK